MSDVAELAGVATMTVSRVMNGSATVADETRLRVHRAIKKLNYQPNQIARSLRRAQSNSIGIIVPNFYDPFFSICAHEISLVAKKHGYSVSVSTSDEDPAAEFAEANQMVLNHVRGVVVIPAAHGKSRLTRPEFHATHIVTLDRPIQNNRFGSVLVENEQGAYEAVTHLIDHGHQRISCLGLSDGLYTIKARHTGYKRAMQDAELTPDEYYGATSEQTALVLIKKLMSARRPPTAFFISNNVVMRHTLHALSQLKLKIPESVALIGFDDLELADIFAPAITVVRQPIRELGRVAAELLFNRLSHKEVSPSGKQIVLPVELVIRQSCGCTSEPLPKP